MNIPIAHDGAPDRSRKAAHFVHEVVRLAPPLPISEALRRSFLFP
jgi:hypothetical protein